MDSVLTACIPKSILHVKLESVSYVPFSETSFTCRIDLGMHAVNTESIYDLGNIKSTELIDTELESVSYVPFSETT
jgi:hypothetical protein